MVETFFKHGWAVFDPESAVSEWVNFAREAAKRALRAPEFDHLYECSRTWFVGLDALGNDSQGRVAGSDALEGRAVDFVAQHLGGWPELHKAQVSGIFPGYPKPREGESDAGFRYRVNRDAAHVDGVIGVGQPKRRFVLEPHQFILGLPLTRADERAAPLVVWEGSHHILQDAFRRAFSTREGDDLATVEVTEIYQQARKTAFETCKRVVVHAQPGSAIVVHRLALHGVAPWQPGATAAPEGRLIAYFRPIIAGGVNAWLNAR